LLTLATGTGKTAIAFQIAWKLFQTRWNLKRDGNRRPRILFLADRNILADQAYNSFSAFPEDALVRIKPNEIKKSGKVPTNGSIFFTIFQTFMSGTKMQNPACRTGRENLHPILANIQQTILILSSLTSATVAEQMTKAIGGAF
jgi:type I restriction enzyme, R subunit